MAALYSHTLLEVCLLSRKVVCGNIIKNVNRHGIRHLYAETTLGVDNYVRTREKVKIQFINMADKFRSKMNEFSEPQSTNMIFTEDLKNMVHLVEQEDLSLILKMMRRFNQQNKELRFGNYVFGPQVMRMFYFLNTPEVAFEAFIDPELDCFFDQLRSYQILMDLLFKNKMYQKVIDVFGIVNGKQIQNAKYPRDIIVLTLAACYKLNTPDSLKFMTNLWKELQTVGHTPMRRAATFAAALALNQNAPHIALEIISGVKQQNYITVRSIKVAALAEIGRPEDCLPLLRSVLEVDDPSAKKQTYTQDVLKRVKMAIERLNNKEMSYHFQQVEKHLREQGHTSEMVLDDFLCSEIADIPSTPNNIHMRDRRFLAASFSQQKNAPGQSYIRPGLKDIY